MATPTAETTFDTDVTTGVGFTFNDTNAPPNGSLTETAPGPTASANQTINSTVAGATLTGNGSSPALTVAAGVTVEFDNVSIANTGAAASVALGAGSTVVFGDGDMGMLDTAAGVTNLGNISAPITGAGGNVQINGAFNNALAVKFSAADTYTGSTTIGANAELILGASGSINSSGTATTGGVAAAVTIAASGRLDVSGAQTGTGAATTLTLHNLADAGTIILGSNSVETAGASTISGAVTGTGGLQIGPVGGTAAANTTTVSDALAYDGSTKVYGDLALTGAGSVANSSNISLKATGATFDISGVTAAEGGATIAINELTGVAGSIVTLGATTLQVSEDATAASFSGVIGGTGGLTVAPGESTFELTLAGKNTYTGDTVIETGATVGLAGAGTLGAGPTAAVAGGAAASMGSALTLDGTLDISQLTTGSFTLGAFGSDTGDGFVTAGANRLIVESTTAADTLGGVTGTGGSLQVGTAAGATPAAGAVAATPDATNLTLTDESTYTGSTVVYGTLVVEGSISDSSNVSLKVAGATVDFSGADNNGTYFTTSNISGNGTEQGVLINELTGVAQTNVTLGDNTLIINETTNASFSGAISGDGYGIVVRGPATLTLDGVNTYSGETLVKGHLAIGPGGSIADSEAVYVNGSLDISGATAGVTAIGSLEGDNANATVVLGSNTLEITGSNNNFLLDELGQSHAFAGVISGAGGVTVAAGGDLELANANTYSGTTTINGTLQLDGGESFNGTTFPAGSINSSASIVDNGALIIEASFAVAGSGVTTSLSLPTAVISGTGSVTLYGDEEGAGSTTTVTVATAETYSGFTYANAVDLVIASGGSLVNSTVGLENGSELDISTAGGSVTIKGLTDFNDGGATTVNLGANTLILSGAGNVGPAIEGFGGVISGSGGLQINSGAGLNISAAQAYTGSTVVYGELIMSDGASLASSNVSLKAVNGVGGILEIGEATAAITELTGQSNSQLQLEGNSLTITETTAASFGGAISGNANSDLIVDGSVFLTLTGNSGGFDGTLTVNGDVALGAATGSSTLGSIGTASNLVDDGIFSIVGGSATIGSLSGTGVVKIGPAPDVLTVDEAAAGSTFSGTIHGAGMLTVEGTGTLVLSGSTSDYSGGTTIGATSAGPGPGPGPGGIPVPGVATGSLELTAIGAAGSGAITFGNANSTLSLTNGALTGGNTATESFGNTLHLATHGGTVDLLDLTFETATSGAGQTFHVLSNGELTITEGNVQVSFMTDLAAGTAVTAMNDGMGHTAFHLAGM